MRRPDQALGLSRAPSLLLLHHGVVRMFVALRPSPEAVDDLDGFLEPRRAAGAFRWTHAEQLHCTLAFLAHVPDRHLDPLVDNLAAAAARRTSFETHVAGGGAFPDAARARVLWAGLHLDDAGREELDLLATGCRHAVSTAGVAVDGHRFRPHLTLARSGSPTGLTRWVRLLDAYTGPTWPVAEVVLVASHLGEGPRRRPRYEDVAAFSLA